MNCNTPLNLLRDRQEEYEARIEHLLASVNRHRVAAQQHLAAAERHAARAARLKALIRSLVRCSVVATDEEPE